MYRSALIAIPLLAVACAPAESNEEFVSRAPAATVVGEERSCISAGNIRRTTVHDDRTIDFRVGSRTYRMTSPSDCPRLGFEESITYDVRGGQICSPGIFYVLETTGGQLSRGPGCAFGKFVPIEYVDRDKDMMESESSAPS